MDKRFEIVWLYDFYAPLITERRRKLLQMHLEDDLSLGEISQITGITRQGVYDAIKAAQDKLEQCEEKLGMLKRYRAITGQVNKCRQILSQIRVEGEDGEMMKLAIKELEKIESIER
ncbi:MAG: DNA-binding protein [Clostridia bacterium]|nr:DNA-binding protein [Clostridia bacterium]